MDAFFNFDTIHPLQLTDNFQMVYILASDTYNVYLELGLYSPERYFFQETSGRVRHLFLLNKYYYFTNI
jgi:hypothetical protein